MSIKVIGAIGSERKTVSQIDLGLGDTNLSKQEQKDLKEKIGELLVEKVLSSVGDSTSPVSGQSWPLLSKEYKKKKKEFGSKVTANMELTGDMLDSLTFKPTIDGIEIGFFNKQAWKADGHLKFSGAHNNTPQRRFLPGEGQSFKRDITSIVNDMIQEAIQESEKNK